jgi:hypothetical protein
MGAVRGIAELRWLGYSGLALGHGCPERETRGMADQAKDGPRLLAGGNPQISKGDGDEPVQAYVAAMPGWKSEVGRRLDQLVTATVPKVRKGVRWNQPFYGADDETWFLSFRCYTDYVQVAFYNGTSLDPMPPKESKHDKVRYLDIREDDDLDERQFRRWVKQARTAPGERM